MKNAFFGMMYVACLAFGLASQGLIASEEAPADAPAQATAETAAEGVMHQPLDASSNDAFKASMAEVKASATEEEFRSLNNAVGMIRSFDQAARNNPEVFLERVNGKTPEQVIEYANERWN